MYTWPGLSSIQLATLVQLFVIIPRMSEVSLDKIFSMLMAGCRWPGDGRTETMPLYGDGRS